MNTNMAEGAAQRLVAEMAQILFGQPGLTLVELAEKVKATQSAQAVDSQTAFIAEQRAHGETIDQRDRYHEVADDLAAHIARITGVDIGEHSSANCPWQNAIKAAEECIPVQASDLEPVRDALQAAARSLRTIADSTKETQFLGTASEIRAYANSRASCAEQAVTDSQAVRP